MAANGGRRQAELIGESRGALRAALEEIARHGVASAVARAVAGAIGVRFGTDRDFHNTSMTYFATACTSPGRDRLPECSTGRSN